MDIQSGHPGKRPGGIIFLVILLAFTALAYLISAGIQSSFFLGLQSTGGTSILINIIIFLLVGALIWSLVSLKPWAFWLGMGLVSFNEINLVIMLILNWTRDYSIIASSLIGGILLNGLILWYLFRKQDLFKTGNDSAKNIDKPFIITALLIIALVILFSMGIISSYSLVGSKEDIIKGVTGKSLDKGLSFCDQKVGEERDYCLMTLSLTHKNESSSPQICTKISDQLVRFSCILAISTETRNPEYCNLLEVNESRMTCKAFVDLNESECQFLSQEISVDMCKKEILELKSQLLSKNYLNSNTI